MKRPLKSSLLAAAIFASAGFSPGAFSAQDAPGKTMGFFVTSVGSGKGGDLGGLAGADQHCQALAQTVGAGG
jgi:hypothetical protein